MPMLALDHVRSGTLADGRLSSVLLKLGDYSTDFLVAGGAQGELFGVFLDGDHRFEIVMASRDGDAWSGFFVDDVRIEVDVGSAVDATHRRPPIGSVVRRSSGSFVAALAGERPYPQRPVELRLADDGQAADRSEAVAFTRWSIVKGDGVDKVVLRAIGDGAGT